jgi:hypothetical protein
VTGLRPPSGEPPPATSGAIDGSSIDLGPLALAACERYFTVYPDDVEGLGPAGRAWCDHDSRYLLAWGLEDARTGDEDCVAQVAWLGRVLVARDFPLERLVAHVGLTASVLRGADLGDLGQRAADRLQKAADELTSNPPAARVPREPS